MKGQRGTGWNLENFIPKPFSVPPVEVYEVPGPDAPGTGKPAAGGAAQGAPLHRYVQTLRVVHRLHHHTAWGGVGLMGVIGAKRRPPAGMRAGGRSGAVRAERWESR